MRILQVAIIGQGRSGRDIHGLYLKTEEARRKFHVCAVVEADDFRRQKAAEEYGCPVYANYTDLFPLAEDIDFVVNSTYSMEHAPITMDLLNHGLSVLVEKPVCRNLSEFDAMVSCAEKNGKYLGVFQQSRFAPYYLQVKKIIDSGVLGELIAVDIQFNGFSRRWDWQTLHGFNGGSLRNTGPHPLDQALHILNDYDRMPEVFCTMKLANTFGDAEDYVKLILRSPGKPLVDLTISCCDAFPSFTYKIHGKNGGLRGSMQHIDWKYFDPGKAPRQKLIPQFISEPDGSPAYCHEELPWITESWDGDPNGAFDSAVAAYYDMVHTHLTEGKPLQVTLKQVRQQVAVYEEAHRQNSGGALL